MKERKVQIGATYRLVGMEYRPAGAQWNGWVVTIVKKKTGRLNREGGEQNARFLTSLGFYVGATNLCSWKREM